MEIINCYIDWNEPFNNPPRVVCIVDERPKLENYRYRPLKYNKACFYLGQQGPFYDFLYHNPANQDGCGGAQVVLTLCSGKKREIIGPWSSNTSAINQVYGVNLVEIGMILSEDQENKTYSHCHVDAEYLKEKVEKFCPDVALIRFKTEFHPKASIHWGPVFRDGRAKPFDIPSDVIKRAAAGEINYPIFIKWHSLFQFQYHQIQKNDVAFSTTPQGDAR